MQAQEAQGFRLSFQQRHLWLSRGAGAWPKARCRVDIDGALDVERLERALERVVERHQILRTAYAKHAGVKVPTQIVVEEVAPIELDRLDLSTLDEKEREACLRELLDRQVEVARDVSGLPPWRLSLVQTGAERCTLVLSLPVLCADARSLENLVSEIARLYAGEEEELVALDELVQYLEFSEWQHELVGDEEAGAAGLKYWAECELAAVPTPSLPLEPRSRDDTEIREPRLVRAVVSDDVAEKISQATEGAGASAELFFLAAWCSLWARLAEPSRTLIYCIADGRPYEELAAGVGLLARALPIASELDPSTSFERVLKALQAQAEEALEWQLSWVPDQDGLPVSRRQIGFEYLEAIPEIEAGALCFRLVERRAEIERFKLALSVVETHEGWELELAYDPALYDDEGAAWLLSLVQTLTASAAGDPRLAIAELELLGPAQQRRWLDELNPSEPVAERAPEVFGALFEHQAVRVPDRVALVSEDRYLSFGELDRRAGRLGARLRELGVGPETVVALALERGLEPVLAILGAFKVGAAYCAPDLDQPRGRLAQILADSGASVLVTSEGLRDALPWANGSSISIDREVELFAPGEAAAPAVERQGAHLAYVVFTSGSTGQPKGVAVEQRQLVSYVRSISERLGVGEGAHFAAVSTLAADLGNTSIFPSLASGGTLHVVNQTRIADPQAMAEYFGRRRIDCLKIVPSHLQALLRGAEPARLLPRRRLVVGGEASGRAWAEALARRSGCAVLNHYGPSEATVGVMTHEVAEGGGGLETLPLGRPLPHCRIYLLDRRLRPVAPWLPGEICIAGEGLARGYLGRPAATAERFSPDPWSAWPGERMYRTGDLSRRLPSGHVVFLGRSDHQVKVRGYRVELGEIEAVLRARAEVAQAVVVAWDDEHLGRRLVAYVVAEDGERPSEDALRKTLAQQLPGYMVPSYVVVLPELPLTRNGKIDRRALPSLEEVELTQTRDQVAARNPVEEVLVALWSELLGREQIGIHDSFFDLGGHSLLATQLISRVREIFDVELELRALFERPTVAGLAGVLGGADASRQPPLTRVARDRDLPLSFAQERLWFIHQLEPSTRAYHIPHALRILGALDVAALAWSFEAIVKRHELLRTRFVTADGKPKQWIEAELAIELPRVDLEQVPAARRQSVLREALRAAIRQPFDLERAPLFRLQLFALAADEHVLLLVLHHAVSDAWSLGVLVAELGELYAAFVEGREPVLPELELQYADYAAWQRERFSGEALAAELDFWRERLEGRTPALELPTDHPRPAVQTDRGAQVELRVHRELYGRLEALGRAAGATGFMVVLTALQALLYRLSGQRHVTVGTPIAGRGRRELECLIGIFINTLVISAEVTEELTFEDLLAQVRKLALGAYARQDLPFEKLVSELQPRRDLSRSPLFQVLLAFQNVPFESLELPELRLERFEIERGAVQFDLSFFLSPTPEGLVGMVEYNLDLFDRTTIQRFLRYFGNLLEAVAAEPELRLAALVLASRAERHQVLVEANDTAVARPGEGALIYQGFEARAAEIPEAVAVVGGESHLSYGALASRAERLAASLRAAGVGPEVRVGVAMERAPEMVTALLGILEAGGAYVPLDPSFPTERLRFMASDAGLTAIVGDAHAEALAVEASAADIGLPVIRLDARASGAPGSAPDARAPSVAPQNLAYVIYTSGSTGRPKGVQVPHAAAANFLHSMAERPGLGAHDVLLSVTTLSFDIALLEIFLPLMRGAKLVLAGSATARDGMALRRLLEASRATLVQATPATWRLLLGAGYRGEATTLAALSGGEALPGELAGRISAVASSVWNLYGPTETAVWSAVERIGETAIAMDRPIALGRPIARTELYVVDRWSHPAPLGVAGELWIGGRGVTRGYLSRPALSAERFVPDPFGREPGARLYRTGDLVRRRAHGELEFLGRLDHQVKVRGFRIELGEIESALAAQPAIGDAVVVLRANPRGAKVLTAYLVLASGIDELDKDALRADLGRVLPEYMIPPVFVVLESLPLTPNRKVDRKALPAPERDALAAVAEFVPPRTESESVLAEIWRELLGAEKVGVHDNFFELGGDSISSIQVISRAARRGLELTPRQIFEYPTIAELSSHAVRGRGSEAAGAGEPGSAEVPWSLPESLDLEALESALQASGAVGIEDVYPTSAIQQGLLFHSLASPGTGVYVQQLSVDFKRGLDPEAFEHAWDVLLERHAILRSAYVWKGLERPFQVVCAGVRARWDRRDWRQLTPEERASSLAEYLEADRRQGFAIEEPPLLRLALIRTGEESYRFLWSFHHVLLDGWSMPIVFGELLASYRAIRSGTRAELEPRRPFRDYVAWLERRDTAVAERYWRQALAGFDNPLSLGIDPRRGRGRETASAPGELQARISRSAADALGAFGRRRGMTLGTLVQGAWAILLSRYAGVDDVVFGLVSSGRSIPLAGIESMVGLFINTLPARVEARPSAELEPWLSQLQASLAEMREFEWTPLHQVHGWSELGRDQPLFQSLQAFENYPVDRSISRASDHDLELGSVSFGDQTNYPLSLVVAPDDGLRIKILYDPERFDTTAIQRLCHHFENLLGGFLAAGVETVSDVPSLAPSERQQVLHEWSGGAGFAATAEVRSKGSMPGRLARWVAESPDAVALSLDGRHLSYGELGARALALAGRLRALGVGPDVPVALCAERSLEMVIGLVGILEAGGAYVPIDPAVPPERSAFILGDALGGIETPVLLTSGELAASLSRVGLPATLADRLEILILEELLDGRGAESMGLPGEPPPEQLAYVIYTSGSTGRPKGVAVSHGNMARLFDATDDEFGFRASDVWTLFHSYAFDFSVWEIWGALAHGGRLVVVPHVVSRSPDAWRELLARERVSVLNQTPSAFRQLVAADERASSALAGALALRYVVFGGEALQPGDLLPWFERHGDRVPLLVNMYGITETTVHVTWRPVSEGDARSGGRSQVGRSLRDLDLHLLDERGQPVAIGVAGEIHVGGAGLARAYLGRSRLTAERFVPDPWSREPGGRLYRSGDLARWSPTGDPEYLGRRDHQVKVRGFRIELGEIEAVLVKHEAVSEALVVVDESRADDTRLVAYLVGTEAQEPPIDGVRAFLRQRLPEYMVPGFFVALDEIPLTPNHKVDRRALPPPRAEPKKGWEAPRNDLEVTIATIWSEVLETEKVGRGDNFYDLGGHSLLMVRVRERLQESLGREFTMLELFEHPQVASLAEHLRRGSADADLPEEEALSGRGDELDQGKRRLAQRRRRASREEI